MNEFLPQPTRKPGAWKAQGRVPTENKFSCRCLKTSRPQGADGITPTPTAFIYLIEFMRNFSLGTVKIEAPPCDFL